MNDGDDEACDADGASAVSCPSVPKNNPIQLDLKNLRQSSQENGTQANLSSKRDLQFDDTRNRQCQDVEIRGHVDGALDDDQHTSVLAELIGLGGGGTADGHGANRDAEHGRVEERLEDDAKVDELSEKAIHFEDAHV